MYLAAITIGVWRSFKKNPQKGFIYQMWSSEGQRMTCLTAFDMILLRCVRYLHQGWRWQECPPPVWHWVHVPPSAVRKPDGQMDGTRVVSLSLDWLGPAAHMHILQSKKKISRVSLCLTVNVLDSCVMNHVPFETGSRREGLWWGCSPWLLDSSMAFSSVFLRVNSSAQLIPRPLNTKHITVRITISSDPHTPRLQFTSHLCLASV